MSNHYKLLYGENFYPLGGYDDYKGTFTCVDDAISYVLENHKDNSGTWAHIVFDDKIVAKGTKDFWKNDKWEWEYDNF